MKMTVCKILFCFLCLYQQPQLSYLKKQSHLGQTLLYLYKSRPKTNLKVF